jgi:hypothetical protein
VSCGVKSIGGPTGHANWRISTTRWQFRLGTNNRGAKFRRRLRDYFAFAFLRWLIPGWSLDGFKWRMRSQCAPQQPVEQKLHGVVNNRGMLCIHLAARAEFRFLDELFPKSKKRRRQKTTMQV